MWIVLATMLSTIVISKAKDEDGREITPEIAFEVALTAYVLLCFVRLTFLTAFFFFFLGSSIAADPSRSSVRLPLDLNRQNPY